jgi:hypothetical protein
VRATADLIEDVTVHAFSAYPCALSRIPVHVYQQLIITEGQEFRYKNLDIQAMLAHPALAFWWSIAQSVRVHPLNSSDNEVTVRVQW